MKSQNFLITKYLFPDDAVEVSDAAIRRVIGKGTGTPKKFLHVKKVFHHKPMMLKAPKLMKAPAHKLVSVRSKSVKNVKVVGGFHRHRVVGKGTGTPKKFLHTKKVFHHKMTLKAPKMHAKLGRFCHLF